VIAIANLTNDPIYKAYRQGRKIRPVVDNLLATTGIDLTNGEGIPELIKFQEHLKEYRIVVFRGLNCKDSVFDGQIESEKRINLHYDDVTHFYHVINTVTGELARRFVCKGCNKGCKSGEMHRCQETCSDYMLVSPCPYTDVRIPCDSYYTQFRSRACLNNHKTNKLGKRQFVKRREIVPYAINS
jgi:hypothetical protein